jgi:hypothetical protein
VIIMRSRTDVAADVAALKELSRDELVARWQKIYAVPPPKGVRQELLIRAVAWHLQEKRLGGMSAETRRLLRSAISRVEGAMRARTGQSDKATDQHLKGSRLEHQPEDRIKAPDMGAPRRERRRLAPGARLMREWGGKTHVVDVIKGGYMFEAKVYPSLTAIAGKITGVHWSGPRFFGL